MATLPKFLESATKAVIARAARRAKTSPAYLGHLAAGRRKGSAAIARRIEIATEGAVPRESVCEACRRCEFLKAAR